MTSSKDQQTYANAWLNKCDVQIELRRLDDAVATCARAVELEPGDPINHYNLAGVHALRGEVEEAVEHLKRDVELGDTEWRWLAEDPWFEGMRDEPRLQAILEEMKVLDARTKTDLAEGDQRF